uniref:Vinculin-binding site-containing domain-containing protein n=1 Tax=Hucho hucho TaxID=62062 RepID=A0A4W5MHK5_9TELE
MFVSSLQLDEGTSPEPEGSFVDYQTTMVKYSKAIAVTAQEMMTKSVTCPEELGCLASQVTTDYSQLALQGRLAAHTAEPEEVSNHYSQSHPSIHPSLLSQFDYYVTLICFLLNKPGTR